MDVGFKNYLDKKDVSQVLISICEIWNNMTNSDGLK